MTCHNPEPSCACDWLEQRPIRSPAQIWVVMRHQYGISALVSQTSFRIVHEYTRVLSTATTNQRRIFVNYDSILNVRLQCEGLDCSIPVVRKERTISLKSKATSCFQMIQDLSSLESDKLAPPNGEAR